MRTSLGNNEPRRQVDKYLTFVLANEHYGVEILKVLEIVGLLEITQVPRAPRHVRGVANLRGKIVPIIDLRRKFDLPDGELTAQSCIIVVRAAGIEAGLLVDRVLEVTPIAADAIEQTTGFGAGVDVDFVAGLAKTDKSVTILLNIDCVLHEKELSEVRQVVEQDDVQWTPELITH